MGEKERGQEGRGGGLMFMTKRRRKKRSAMGVYLLGGGDSKGEGFSLRFYKGGKDPAKATCRAWTQKKTRS